MSYLSFSPKSEKDLTDLLEPGMGAFEVTRATHEVSKTTNKPMIKLVLKCWDQKGKEGIIFDNLVIDERNFSLRKIRHFCVCVGLTEDYEQGRLDPYKCNGKAGKIMIGIQKDKEGNYPDKNNIKDYLPIETSTNKDPAPFNDDIPFN